MSKRKAAADEKLIERAYYETCSGIQIDVMDIGKVFAYGRAQLATSADYEALKSAVRAYVETIRKN